MIRFILPILICLTLSAQEPRKVDLKKCSPPKEQAAIIKEEVTNFLEAIRKNPKHRVEYQVRRGSTLAQLSIHAIAWELRPYAVLYQYKDDRTADNITHYQLRAK